jgi:hypothetical protein
VVFRRPDRVRFRRLGLGISSSAEALPVAEVYHEKLPVAVAGESAVAEEPLLPEAGEAHRPWEERGAVRRDCAPHRGNVLRLLGGVALACGGLSWCLAVPALIGLPLGVAVWVVVQRDLDRMKAGAMDPQGRALTLQAMDWGIAGAVLSFMALFVFGLAVLFVWHTR